MQFTNLNTLMKYIISAYMWVAGLLVFIPTLIFGIFLFKITNPKKTFPFYQRLIRLIFLVIFVRVKREYQHPLKKKAYIFMPNHVSFIDSPIMAAYFPHYTRAIETKSHFSWPLYGPFIRAYGNICIDRSSKEASKKTFDYTIKKLREGSSILVYPEGTRTRNGQLGKFKLMPFQFALESGCDIVPVSMSGVYELNQKGSWIVRPVRVRITYGKPIPYSSFKHMDKYELQEFVRVELQDMLDHDLVIPTDTEKSEMSQIA